MIRRPPRSTQSRSSAASDVYKRQGTPPRPVRGPAPRPRAGGAAVGGPTGDAAGRAHPWTRLRRQAAPGRDPPADGGRRARGRRLDPRRRVRRDVRGPGRGAGRRRRGGGRHHARRAGVLARVRPPGGQGAGAGGVAHGRRRGRRAGACRMSAVTLRPRSALALTLASVIGLAAFCWPLLAGPSSPLGSSSSATDSTLLFAVLLPLAVSYTHLTLPT